MEAGGSDHPGARRRGKIASTSCKACRTSKTKCDIDSCKAGTCSRCARLSILCEKPPPARRGRWGTSASRLGPALRELMATEPEVKLTTSDTSAASKRVSGGQGGAQTVTVHEAVQHLLAGAGPRRIADPATTAMEDGCWMLHSRLMQEEGGNLGQLLWVKTYFAVARRTKSWGKTRGKPVSLAELVAGSGHMCLQRVSSLTSVSRPRRCAPSPGWFHPSSPTCRSSHTRCTAYGQRTWPRLARGHVHDEHGQ